MSNVLNFEVTANRLELKDGFRPVNTEYNYTQIRVKFAAGYGWENCTLITAGYFVSANQILSVAPSASAELTFTFAIPAEMRGSGVSEFHFGVVGSYVENGQTVTVATNIVTISAARGLLIGEVVDLSAYEKLLAAINAGLALKEDKANKVSRIESDTNLNSTTLYPSISAMIHYLAAKYYDKDDVDGIAQSLETDVTAWLTLKESLSNKVTAINSDNSSSNDYYPTVNAVVSYLVANFYTQSQINSSFYTKTSVDTMLSAKADNEDVEASVNELKSRIAATDVGRETAQGSVGISKLDFVTLGDNLFNKDGNHTPNSYVNASGKITSTYSYYLSEYIKVSANTLYYVHGYSGNDNYTKLRCVAEYDEKLTFIQRTENVSSSITTGANTAYVRIAFPPANAYMTYFGTAAYNNQRFSAVIPGALVDISEKLAPLQADIAGNTAKINAVTENPELFVLESQVNDGVTVTNHGDGTYTFNGENSTNTLFPSFTLAAGKYTAKMAVVSGSSTASGGGAVQAAIRYGSGDGTTWLNINNASAEITFDAATPVYFRLNHGSFSSWKLRISIEIEDSITAVDKTAREKAAELRTDVDSAAASINDISEARNLFKFDSQTLDGISVLNLGDGVFIINGANSTTSLFPAFVLPAGTYNATLEKLSGTASNQYAVKYGDSGTTWVSTNKSASTVTFSKAEKVFFRLNYGTYTNLMLKIRIENVTAIDKFLRAKTDARRTALFPLPEPEGFTWKDSPLHGRILTDFRDVYEVDFDVAEYRNAIGTAVYVAPDGNDNNAGTIDAPLANMSTAYGIKNADTIYLLPGVYNRIQTLYSTPITRNINIIGLGSGAILSTKVVNIINISEYSTGVWACSANSTTYLTNVVDLVNKNSDGRYTKYTQLDSIPAVEESEGSWALISNVAYIHTIGGVKPVNGENLLLLHSTTPTSSNKYPLFKVTGGSVYFENLVCFGGSSALDVEAQSKNQIINVYGKNCKFFLSRRVSDSVERDVVMLLGTTLSIFQNCEASYGMKDGFNYHAKNYGTSQSPDYGVAPKAIEINCVGIGNGNIDDGNDQGSTIHDGGSIIRVKDLCAHNYGSNFADQGDGTESWNIACVGFESWCDYTRPTPSRSQNSNFYAYTGTKMFCDGCVGFGSLNDISGAGDIFISNSHFTGYLKSEAKRS